MDNKEKDKYRVFGIVFGFLAFWILIFIFIAYPAIREIINNSDDIQKKIIDNDINQADIKKIPDMGKTHQLFTQKQDTLDVITNKGNEVDFIKNLESLAVATGNTIELKINDGKSGASSDSKSGIIGNLPYNNYVSIEISLTGNYAGFINFLNKLERFGKYANIVALNLSKAEVEMEGGNTQNIFNSKGGPKNDSQTTKSKEVLESIINLVVYVKK